MKINTLFLIIMGFSGLSSCFSPPEYSNTPKISYSDVLFKTVGDFSEPDSLIIVINFEDGDGDLGLSEKEGQDLSPPFNLRNFYDRQTGEKLSLNVTSAQFPSLDDYIDFLSERIIRKSEIGLIDTLPLYTGNALCLNWAVAPSFDVIYNNNPVSLITDDTLYYQTNPRHYNMFVDFLVKENGVFTEYDWRLNYGAGCGTSFDGRFQILSDDLSKDKTLEGSIRYRMRSLGFLPLFSTKTLKLRIQIVDRAGNFSNVVETPEFLLSDIREN